LVRVHSHFTNIVLAKELVDEALLHPTFAARLLQVAILVVLDNCDVRFACQEGEISSVLFVALDERLEGAVLGSNLELKSTSRFGGPLDREGEIRNLGIVVTPAHHEYGRVDHDGWDWMEENGPDVVRKLGSAWFT